MSSLKRSYIGSVIEFRLPNYFVYGVVVNENADGGDTIVMFAPKYTSQIETVEELYFAQIRYHILFFSKIAAAKRNQDVMRVLAKLEMSHLPKFDRRFRMCLAGISEGKKWQIVEGDSRSAIHELTPDLAHLSEGEIPNLEAIREFYDADYYPWSAALTSRGLISFDPEQMEAQKRQELEKSLPARFT